MYLTDKALRKSPWELPVAGLCLFFAAFAAAVTVDFLREGDWTTAAVGVGLLALLLWPVVRVFRRRLGQKCARRLAAALDHAEGERVPLQVLAAQASMPDLPRKLQKMLDEGYLKNVWVDLAAEEARLDAVSASAARDYIEVECPGCGAKNVIPAGQRTARCAFCEQELTLRGGAAKGA